MYRETTRHAPLSDAKRVRRDWGEFLGYFVAEPGVNATVAETSTVAMGPTPTGVAITAAYLFSPPGDYRRRHGGAGWYGVFAIACSAQWEGKRERGQYQQDHCDGSDPTGRISLAVDFAL